jgi:hypothetical protein
MFSFEMSAELKLLRAVMEDMLRMGSLDGAWNEGTKAYVRG